MKSTYLQLHIRPFIPARVQGQTSEGKNQILGNVSTRKASYYDLYFIYKHFVSSFIPHALSSVDLQFGTKSNRIYSLRLICMHAL